MTRRTVLAGFVGGAALLSLASFVVLRSAQNLAPGYSSASSSPAPAANVSPGLSKLASTSAAPAPYAVPRNRDKAVKALEVHEQKLHDTLDGLALRAQSGQFARLLASMGAAVHQRLAEWPA